MPHTHILCQWTRKNLSGFTQQVIIIYAATKKHLLDIKVEDILRFEKELFEFIQTKYPEIPESIKMEKVITEETEKALVNAIEEFKQEF